MINSVERIVSEIFEIDEKDLTDTHSPDNVEAWDSMNHLRLVTAIESEYDIRLSMREVQSMLSVGDIKKVSIKCWLKFNCKVSPRAEVEITPFLSIGEGSVIGSFCKIKAPDGTLKIGTNVSIATNSFIASHKKGIEIGDHCMIGPSASIVSINYSYDRLDIPMCQQVQTSKGIIIGSDVWISSGCVILDGAKIGNGSIITPNSVVSGSVPENSIVQGNPGQVIFTRR